MIKALIFDMDGTLVDSEGLHFESWRQTLAARGVTSFPFADFVHYVGTSNEKLAQDYIVSDRLDCSVEELVSEKQDIYLELIPGVKLLPGVRKVIDRFHSVLRLAVASSSARIELHRILEVRGLDSRFELVVGGDMVEQKKPDPEIYLKSSELLGLEPDECVALEDSEPGIAAAKQAGMYGVAIPNSLSIDHDFRQADRVLSRIDELDETVLDSLTG